MTFLLLSDAIFINLARTLNHGNTKRANETFCKRNLYFMSKFSFFNRMFFTRSWRMATTLFLHFSCYCDPTIGVKLMKLAANDRTKCHFTEIIAIQSFSGKRLASESYITCLVVFVQIFSLPQRQTTQLWHKPNLRSGQMSHCAYLCEISMIHTICTCEYVIGTFLAIAF